MGAWALPRRKTTKEALTWLEQFNKPSDEYRGFVSMHDLYLFRKYIKKLEKLSQNNHELRTK